MEIPNGSTPNKKDKRAAKAGKGGKKETNGDASPEAHKDDDEGMVGPDTPPEVLTSTPLAFKRYPLINIQLF